MTQPSAENQSGVLQRSVAHSTNNDFIWMTIPLLAMAIYLYGARPAGLCAAAVLTANLCDRLVAVLRSRPYDKAENSSIAMAMILTLLFPATVSYYVVILSVAIGVLVGKAAFGGYGVYPFNPAALGYAVAAVSWPQEVFKYPVPFTKMSLLSTAEATLVDSASHTLRAGGMPNISLFNLLLGNYAGSMGVTAVLVLVACAMFLWMRKRLTLSAPFGFLLTCAAIAFLFPRLGSVGLDWPWMQVRLRLLSVLYELLSGALLYAAVFLLNEPVTMPKNERSRLFYGILMGFTTMMFRYFGIYDLGVCFAVLAVNSASGWLDRMMSRMAARKEVHRL